MPICPISDIIIGLTLKPLPLPQVAKNVAEVVGTASIEGFLVFVTEQ